MKTQHFLFLGIGEAPGIFEISAWERAVKPRVTIYFLSLNSQKNPENYFPMEIFWCALIGATGRVPGLRISLFLQAQE